MKRLGGNGFSLEISDARSPKRLLPLVIDKFKSQWLTSYDYSCVKPTKYLGKELNFNKIHPEITRTALYGRILFDSLERKNLGLSTRTIAEIDNWNSKGGLCIYLSTLMFNSLQYNGVKNVQYVQGLFWHKLREGFPAFMGFGKFHAGLHAWLAIEDAVIDIAIGQEETVFDFGNRPWIAGKVPQGMDLIGFSESPGVCRLYGEYCARDMGLSYENWIAFHQREMVRVLSVHLKKL